MIPRSEQKNGKIFYGWYILLAAAVGLFMGYVPMIGYTFSVFFNPLSKEFHWSRAEISLAFSLSLLSLSVVLPIAGRLVDRFGARRVILPAAVLFGTALASFYFLTDSLWHFYAIYLFLGIVGGGTAPVPYYNVVSHWFDKRRGLALGLAMGGAGIGTFFMPFFSFALITKVGWRAAYALIGLVIVAVTLPVVGLFLKDNPLTMGLLPDGEMDSPSESKKEGRDSHGLSSREALRTRTFWLMCSAFLLVSMSLNGCLIHLVPMLSDRGVSARNAALATSLLGGANLLGRIGTGFLLDRLLASYVAACFFFAAAIGVLLLWGRVTGGLIFLAPFLVGLGIGAEGDIMAYLVSRYFGLRAFGETYGYVLSVFTLGGMIGPLLMGIGFDATNSYDVVLVPFLLATLFGSGLMILLGPYRPLEPEATLAVD